MALADDLAGAGSGGRMGQAADAVLDDDHGAVHDQPEIDRAQAHQAAGDAVGQHQVSGEEHGERNRRGDDQSGSQVSQQHKQDHDDENPSLGEVPSNRADRLLDEGAPIVVGVDDHAFRQHLLDLLHLLLEAVDHDAPVLAREQIDDGGDGLAASVTGGGALTDHGGEADGAHVPHVDRGAARSRLEDHGLQVLKLADQAHAANDAKLAVGLLDVAAARIEVVAADRLEDLVQGDAPGLQPVGVELHLVGLQLASQGVHLDHARHALEPAGNFPVEDGPQLHEGSRFGAIRSITQLELVDLPQAGCDRPHLGLTEFLREYRREPGRAAR